MRLLAAGIDSTVIALWLGHENVDTTRIYLHADMKIKERAMDRTAPTGAQPGRYAATDDKLLAFLQSL
jgi:integrase/recombinase XerD